MQEKENIMFNVFKTVLVFFLLVNKIGVAMAGDGAGAARISGLAVGRIPSAMSPQAR